MAIKFITITLFTKKIKSTGSTTGDLQYGIERKRGMDGVTDTVMSRC